MRHEVFSGETAFVPDRNARRLKQDDKRIDRAGLTLGLILAVFAASAAFGEPRTIDDCEKIQAADAYNQCLASFGPAAHEHAHSADPEGASGSSGRENAAADPEASRPRGSRYHYQRHATTRQRHADPWANMRHAGRHRIEFSIK